MPKPVVAIVGRPNVGKSTLMNRLIKSREAIVDETPGVTRDRLYRDCEWNGRVFSLVDTGGILVYDTDKLRNLIRFQVEMAIDEADLILFVLDVKDGIHPLDQDVADLLRNAGKKIIVVANKADNLDRSFNAAEFFSLGWGEPMPVSSINGTGTGDLLDRIVEELPPSKGVEVESEQIHICIVGKPNVGKSSLLNAILGENRAIVSSEPGTTRDAVDSTFSWGGHNFVIVDTAGLRRKGKIENPIEYYSAHRARKAIKRSHVGLLVIDANEPGVAQDRRIGGLLQEEGKGVVIVVNKWDLIEARLSEKTIEDAKKDFEKSLRKDLDFLHFAPIIFISALTKKGLHRVLPEAVKIYGECMKKIDTPIVNQLLQEAFHIKAPPSFKGQNLKLYYAFQGGIAPPTFVMKVNSPKLVHFSYRRYLENQIRKAFGFEGTPVRLVFKK